MENIELKYYVPLNGTYKVFVPEEFIIEDEEETGFLSLVSIDSSSCFTVSVYVADDILIIAGAKNSSKV
jgi:hypothetical protein